MFTKGKTSVIKKVQTYQHEITATNQDILRNTVGRESGKKGQSPTRTKTTRRNSIIAKLTITKKRIATRRKRQKNNMQTTSQKT